MTSHHDTVTNEIEYIPFVSFDTMLSQSVLTWPVHVGLAVHAFPTVRDLCSVCLHNAVCGSGLQLSVNADHNNTGSDGGYGLGDDDVVDENDVVS